MFIHSGFTASRINPASRPATQPGAPLFAGSHRPERQIAALEKQCREQGLDTVQIKASNIPPKPPLSDESRAKLNQPPGSTIKKRESNRLAQAYSRQKQLAYIAAMEQALKYPASASANAAMSEVDAEGETDYEYVSMQARPSQQSAVNPFARAQSPATAQPVKKFTTREDCPLSDEFMLELLTDSIRSKR